VQAVWFRFFTSAVEIQPQLTPRDDFR
jgi:hypothetical protein